MEHILDRQLKDLYSLWNGTNGLYTNWARKRGMSYYSVFVLYAIYNSEGKCSPKRICDEWSMPKQTVSSILKNFQSKGYVFFITDEDDRRNKSIVLTEEGNRFAGQLLRELYQIERTIIQRIGQADMEAMLRVNRLFYEYFQEELEKES